jgi:hypothetical protein
MWLRTALLLSVHSHYQLQPSLSGRLSIPLQCSGVYHEMMIHLTHHMSYTMCTMQCCCQPTLMLAAVLCWDDGAHCPVPKTVTLSDM